MGCSLSSVVKKEQSLIEAVRNCDDLEVERLSRENPSCLNEVDKEGWTALHWALGFASEDLIRMLIDRGISIQTKDNDGSTPLHLASRFGKTEEVKLLLKHGARVNITDKYGRTPLHRAAKFGNLKTVRVLLAAGAIVDFEDCNQCTPLLFAVQSKRYDIIKELITKHDAFIHHSDIFGNTPYLECQKLYIDFGAQSMSICKMWSIFEERHIANQCSVAPTLQQICRKYFQLQNPNHLKDSITEEELSLFPQHLLNYVTVKS